MMKSKWTALLTSGILFAGACTTQQAWLNDAVTGLFARIDKANEWLAILVDRLQDVA